MARTRRTKMASRFATSLTVLRVTTTVRGHIDASILDEQEELQQQFEEVQLDPELLAETTQTVADTNEDATPSSPEVDEE